MEQFWRELRQSVDVYSGRLVGAAVILTVGMLALRYLVVPLRRLLERGRLEPATVSFLANSVRGLLLVVIVIGVLQQFGVETTSLLTVLAAGGLAIALSLQNALANFTAGLLLLSFRLLRVGDVIETGAMRGRVADILPFHVILIGDDNQSFTVPNSTLTNSGFANYSARPERRLQWLLSLKPSDELTATKAALCDRLRADPRILREPPPRAFVQDWGEDKRVLAVQAWTATAEQQAVRDDLLEALGVALEGVRSAKRERQ